MTLDELKAIMADGRFHHATYRDHGTIWEGLWIYIKDPSRRTFKPAGSFSKNDPNLDAAYDLVRPTGVSTGAYGRG